MWKDISFIGIQNSNIFNFFLGNCNIKVGDGCRIKFWHDKWCGVSCLKEEFPSLFNLSTEKSGSLHQIFARKSGPDWHFLYRRALYAWELADEVKLIALLSSAPFLIPASANSLVWSAGSCSFSVSSLYSFSSSLHGPNLSITKFIWSNIFPPKVHFFGWLAWKNRIKSAVFLQILGILGPSASTSCSFCNSALESAQHILLHCPFSWSIWSHVLFEWRLQWCIPDSVADVLNWWMGVKFKSPLRNFWRAIPLVVLWSLWKHRNECVFTNASPNPDKLWDLIKFRLAFWLKNSLKDFPFSMVDVVLNWRQIICCY